jgi:plasmid stabilization system protein ParE
MLYHIDHYPDALADVQRGFRWYRKRSPGAALRFLSAVDELLLRIQQNPYQFAVYLDDTRACKLKNYPYIMIYRLFSKSVTIYAVIHAKRRDHHWRKRLR